MTPNQQLRRPVAVDKADMALSDLTSGGRLLPAQLKQYIRVAIKKSVMMGLFRVTTIPTPEYNLPKMTTLGEVMQPATSGVALAEAERSKVGLTYVQLVAKHGKAEVDIPREVLEDQIERGAFKGSVMAYLGEHTSRDLENQALNGNASGSGYTAWMKLNEGMITQTTSNTQAAGGVTLDKDVLKDLDETMPEEFDAQSNLAYFTNRKAYNDYKQSLSDRTGGLSDAIVDGSKKEIGYGDRVLKKIPLFPNNLGGSTNETRVVLANPKGFIYAFYRKVTLDTEFAVRAQKYIIVLTLRSDCLYEHEPAAAMSTGVLGQ